MRSEETGEIWGHPSGESRVLGPSADAHSASLTIEFRAFRRTSATEVLSVSRAKSLGNHFHLRTA